MVYTPTDIGNFDGDIVCVCKSFYDVLCTLVYSTRLNKFKRFDSEQFGDDVFIVHRVVHAIIAVCTNVFAAVNSSS